MTPEEFRNTFDVLPEPTMLLTAEGTVLAANRAIEDQFGWDRLLLPGRRLVELFAGPAARAGEYLDSCSRSPSLIRAAFTFVSARGVYVPCHCEGAALPGLEIGERSRILLRLLVKERSADPFFALNEKIEGLTREVGVRKTAELKAQQHWKWIQATLASISDAVITTDALGCVTFLNPAAESLTGWSQDEAAGVVPLEQVFHIMNEESRKAIDNPVAGVLREGVAMNLPNNTVLVARDGTARPIDDSASPIRDDEGRIAGVILVFRDVTDRRRAETALRDSEEHLRLALKAARMVTFDWNVPRNRFTWSRWPEEIEGLKPADFVDTYETFSGRVHPEDLPGMNAEVARCTAAHEPFYREFRVMWPDASVRWVTGQGQFIYGTDGETLRMSGVMRDTTASKRAEDEIRTLNAELEQRVIDRTQQYRESNSELEAFAFSVSHDLRAPLRALEGISQALLEDYGEHLDDVGKDYTRRLAAAAHDMDSLIQDLLDYSRLSRGEMHLESVDLAAAVAKARDQLAVDIRERQATIIVQGSMPRVRAHPATLVQIIANLLANAIKFVDTNSRPRVRVWAEESVGGVRLWIEDNGIGIAHEHQDRVFRVFERLHGVETYPGSGIGLAIVRKGTSRMGGLVGVESQPGRGSRFWIELTLNGRNI